MVLPDSRRQGVHGGTKGVLIDLSELLAQGILGSLPQRIGLTEECVTLVTEHDPPDPAILGIALNAHEAAAYQGLQVGRDRRAICGQMLREGVTSASSAVRSRRSSCGGFILEDIAVPVVRRDRAHRIPVHGCGLSPTAVDGPPAPQ